MVHLQEMYSLKTIQGKLHWCLISLSYSCSARFAISARGFHMNFLLQEKSKSVVLMQSAYIDD